MTVTRKVGFRELVDRAAAEVEAVDVRDARPLVDDDGVVFVDLRDVREIAREGRIPGSLHVPRGMLEFWLDPDSPYAVPAFQEDRRFVFYCNLGWRSALATQRAQDMGLENACHLDGGFSAWQEAGAPVERVEKKR